jgi:hypothetical protein
MALGYLYQVLAFLPLIGVWYTTFVLAIPIHQQLLQHGKDCQLIHQLIRVHAWRTAFWALRLIAVLLWILR